MLPVLIILLIVKCRFALVQIPPNMAPAAKTQTTVLEKIETNCVEYELDKTLKSSLKSNIIKEKRNANDNTEIYTQNTDIYDQVLPKNEYKYMSYIRNWEKRIGFVTPIRWIDAIAILTMHAIIALGVLYSIFIYNFIPRWETIALSYLLGQIAGFGVTGGAHRYWTHRSYKATKPMQILLLVCYSCAGQNNLFQWVRDHRVHHKFSETDADPHNANRGFFFAHMGWLMMKKHPDVLREGAKIDMSDIYGDPLVRFYTKYFAVFKALFCFIIPMLVQVMLLEESWVATIFCQGMRYLLQLNFTWSVNSFAHLWGYKPYDRHIMPVENKGVSIVAMGEGWHNYHHTFPWDYKAAELPYPRNVTTNIIDLFAKIGWTYDRRVASPSMIQAVIKNKGDPLSPKMHEL